MSSSLSLLASPRLKRGHFDWSSEDEGNLSNRLPTRVKTSLLELHG